MSLLSSIQPSQIEENQTWSTFVESKFPGYIYKLLSDKDPLNRAAVCNIIIELLVETHNKKDVATKLYEFGKDNGVWNVQKGQIGARIQRLAEDAFKMLN
jgi:hypothetical protein